MENKPESKEVRLAKAIKTLKAQMDSRIAKLAMVAKRDQTSIAELQGMRGVVDQIMQILQFTATKDEIARERALSEQVYSAFRSLSTDVQQGIAKALREAEKKPDMMLDGKEIKYRQSEDAEWEVLFSLEDIKGERGPRGSTGVGQQGPQGEKGDTGDTGPKGDQGDQGVKGDKGDQGDAATIAVGTITTLDAGEDATVTNSGTAQAAVFDFGIPQGLKGDTGDTGAGVASGGTAGQALTKVDGTDYNTQWTTLTKTTVGLGNVDNTSDLNKPISTATQSALDLKADLEDGKIPASQLPAYVDGVLEYADLASFPATGESGKIYIAQDTNITYRWTGTGYAEISQSLALGETSATAYRGDRGKTAYDHSQLTSGNPHSVTASDLSLATVATTGAYSDLSGKPTIPDQLSDLTDDSTHRLVTDTEKTTWNGKQDALTLPLSIASGGTGATTAADARSTLGAVSKTGDTMTGDLTISRGASDTTFAIAADSGLYKNLQFRSGNYEMFRVFVDNSNNFGIARYSDVGAYLGAPLTIYKSSGQVNIGDPDLYVNGNCSAESFTDRTPFFEGDALAEIAKIKGVNGEIDHDSLPEFARKKIKAEKLTCKTIRDNEGNEVPEMAEVEEDGRDLGAMISLLTVAVQQLNKRLNALEKNKK